MSFLKRIVLQVILFTICSRHIGQVIFVSEVILFSCLITVLICIKNPPLFDLCINISNKVILVLYCFFVFYSFYVFSMFYSYCFDMYIDVRLSHLNKDYLLRPTLAFGYAALNAFIAARSKSTKIQWRINHEAMEARASGPQFLGQKNRPRIPTQFRYLRSLIFIIAPFGHRQKTHISKPLLAC